MHVNVSTETIKIKIKKVCRNFIVSQLPLWLPKQPSTHTALKRSNAL